jgi:hypothetical protein
VTHIEGPGAGLKIRPKTLHDTAVTCNVLIRSVLAFSLSASRCTMMLQHDRDPALDPALEFARKNRADLIVATSRRLGSTGVLSRGPSFLRVTFWDG